MWKLYIVPIFAIIAGIWELPNYGFYQFLRIVVGLQSAGYALVFYNEERIWDKMLSLGLFAIAILFFPIFNFHFSRDDWEIIDIIVGLCLIIINFYIIKIDKSKSSSEKEKLQEEIRNLYAENRKLKEKISTLEQTLESNRKLIKIQNNKIDREDYYELLDKYNKLENKNENLKNGIKILLNRQKVNSNNITFDDFLK